ncbi:hypothetical protein [Spirosoma sp. KNUC1025]|uniref:hypothetical protein n=1 Tax=Spirosoma sp. KNUC1025 TaxID=2894082 RepID=UPI00386E6E0E|nr:hypothetical protein LN737_19165 [Spirosoma sp. KNUC1025]
MNIHKLPTLNDGDTADGTFFAKLSNYLNEKVCGTVVTPTAAITPISHGYGSAMNLPVGSYHITVIGEDAEGWPLSGVRIDKTTADVCQLVLSDSISLPFTGKVALLFIPL